MATHNALMPLGEWQPAALAQIEDLSSTEIVAVWVVRERWEGFERATYVERQFFTAANESLPIKQHVGQPKPYVSHYALIRPPAGHREGEQ